VFRRNVLSMQNGIKPKILTVSSDKLLANIRHSILSRVGYTVTAAETATDALAKLASQSFDLLILCHTLKRKDKRLLQSESKAKNIPVLSISDCDPGDAGKNEVGSLDHAAGFLAKVKSKVAAPQWIGRNVVRDFDA
jgi:DNA-binding response OmpR family regulator